MNKLILNIGLNVGDFQPQGQLEKTFGAFINVFGTLPHLVKVVNWDEKTQSDWLPENTFVATVNDLPVSEIVLEAVLQNLCEELNQQAISYIYNGKGEVVFDRGYEGEKYKFNSDYFKTI